MTLNSEHEEALAQILAEQPGGHTGDLARRLRSVGIFLDRKSIAHILWSSDRFVRLGEGIPGWYLAEQLNSAADGVDDDTLTWEKHQAELRSVWPRDVAPDDILDLLDP